MLCFLQASLFALQGIERCLKLEDWFLPSHAVEYRSAWIWKIGFCCHMLWGIECLKLEDCLLWWCGGAPRGGRPQTQNFSLVLVQMLAVCRKICMKSNQISPIVWTEKGSAWNNTSVSFSLMLVQMLAVCLKMCMKSNRICPIVWTEKGSAWNNTSVSAIINSTMVEYQALHIWRSRWSV